MKIIALGDTHGRTNWEEIVADEKDADKVIFIGDYFDTHEDTTPEEQIENFKEIVGYKKANPDKVVLLLGNHDYHYLPTVSEKYSGFQPEYALQIGALIQKAIEDGYIQMCAVIGDQKERYLFTHAGVSSFWLKSWGIPESSDLETEINLTFKNNLRAFKFTMGRNFSNYGDDVTQTPIWIRPNSLKRSLVNGYTQVVGHTTQPDLIRDPDGIILIDCLGTSGEYLILDVDK